jgi:hypothetical protein
MISQFKKPSSLPQLVTPRLGKGFSSKRSEHKAHWARLACTPVVVTHNTLSKTQLQHCTSQGTYTLLCLGAQAHTQNNITHTQLPSTDGVVRGRHQCSSSRAHPSCFFSISATDWHQRSSHGMVPMPPNVARWVASWWVGVGFSVIELPCVVCLIWVEPGWMCWLRLWGCSVFDDPRSRWNSGFVVLGLGFSKCWPRIVGKILADIDTTGMHGVIQNLGMVDVELSQFYVVCSFLFRFWRQLKGILWYAPPLPLYFLNMCV